jgi:transposase
MTLTAPERMELERRVASCRGRADEARRARCILLATAGMAWAEIRTLLHCSDSYIARWTGRFAAERPAGLYSRHRGQPASKLTARLEATRHAPGAGATHWSTRRLGRHLGLSHMMVARVWAKHGLKPHRLERYLASDDPDFERKAADIIGLYLKPPQQAAVFCVDEKTAIQALDRLDPVLPLSPGRA